MRTCIYPAAVLIAAVVAGGIVPTVEARQPYHGSFEGNCTRKIPKAKPKKKKLQCRAETVQTGGPYDARTTVEASGGGEKVEIVLDFSADNSLDVKINGQAFAGNLRPNKGRIPTAKKKLRYKGTAKGTAEFVGPLKQTIKAEGKMNGANTTFSGFIDLVSDVLILKLDLKSTADSRLGAKASFQLKASRTGS